MKKTNKLHTKHVLLTDELLQKLEAEAKKLGHKISPFLRHIIEERYSEK